MDHSPPALVALHSGSLEVVAAFGARAIEVPCPGAPQLRKYEHTAMKFSRYREIFAALLDDPPEIALDPYGEVRFGDLFDVGRVGVFFQGFCATLGALDSLHARWPQRAPKRMLLHGIDPWLPAALAFARARGVFLGVLRAPNEPFPWHHGAALRAADRVFARTPAEWAAYRALDVARAHLELLEPRSARPWWERPAPARAETAVFIDRGHRHRLGWLLEDIAQASRRDSRACRVIAEEAPGAAAEVGGADRVDPQDGDADEGAAALAITARPDLSLALLALGWRVIELHARGDVRAEVPRTLRATWRRVGGAAELRRALSDPAPIPRDQRLVSMQAAWAHPECPREIAGRSEDEGSVIEALAARLERDSDTPQSFAPAPPATRRSPPILDPTARPFPPALDHSRRSRRILLIADGYERVVEPLIAAFEAVPDCRCLIAASPMHERFASHAADLYQFGTADLHAAVDRQGFRLDRELESLAFEHRHQSGEREYALPWRAIQGHYLQSLPYLLRGYALLRAQWQATPFDAVVGAAEPGRTRMAFLLAKRAGAATVLLPHGLITSSVAAMRPYPAEAMHLVDAMVSPGPHYTAFALSHAPDQAAKIHELGYPILDRYHRLREAPRESSKARIAPIVGVNPRAPWLFLPLNFAEEGCRRGSLLALEGLARMPDLIGLVKMKNDNESEALRRAFGRELPNLRFLEPAPQGPSSAITTEDLCHAAHAVVSVGSSIASKAMYLGRPHLLVRRERPEDDLTELLAEHVAASWLCRGVESFVSQARALVDSGPDADWPRRRDAYLKRQFSHQDDRHSQRVVDLVLGLLDS